MFKCFKFKQISTPVTAYFYDRLTEYKPYIINPWRERKKESKKVTAPVEFCVASYFDLKSGPVGSEQCRSLAAGHQRPSRLGPNRSCGIGTHGYRLKCKVYELQCLRG